MIEKYVRPVIGLVAFKIIFFKICGRSPCDKVFPVIIYPILWSSSAATLWWTWIECDSHSYTNI